MNTRVHDLRHGVASMLLERAVDVGNVSLVLGHSGAATTGTTVEFTAAANIESDRSARRAAHGIVERVRIARTGDTR
jgi:integrase